LIVRVPILLNGAGNVFFFFALRGEVFNDISKLKRHFGEDGIIELKVIMFMYDVRIRTYFLKVYRCIDANKRKMIRLTC